jgi:hypothetical protein
VVRLVVEHRNIVSERVRMHIASYAVVHPVLCFHFVFIIHGVFVKVVVLIFRVLVDRALLA